MARYFGLMSNAILAMHRKHGNGDVREIRQYADGKIEIVLSSGNTTNGHIMQLPSGRSRIYLYGHSLTVQIVGL